MIDLADTDPTTHAWFEHRNNCEDGVIGGLMADPVKIPEVATVVRESDFSDPFMGVWYRLAVELYDAGLFTRERLRGELRRLGFLENISDVTNFAKLSGSMLSTDLFWHANELRRMSSLQTLRRLLAILANQSSELDADPVKIASAFEAQLADVYSSPGKLWESAFDVASRVYENHRACVEDQDKSRMGLATGYIDIDEITGGYFRGQLWQIAARSYMGKSTVALAFSQRQVDKGRGVYVASYEMINDEMMERMLSDCSAVPLKHFTQATIVAAQLPAIKASIEHFREKYMLLDQMPPDSVAALKARVKLAASHRDISLVVVDHLGLFPYSPRMPRHQQLVQVTAQLKAMAKELNVTVLLLNQLNADADNSEPNDTHYAESKGILANLDVSILLHRETKTSEEMKCKITKNRKGAPGECKLHFDGECQRVDTWVEENTWKGQF